MRDVDKLRDKLNAYMQDKGLRSTEQRRLVTETFFANDGHLSIEQVLDLVRADEPKIGYATVYRTLKLLKASGLAYERHFDDGISRYEIAWEDEHHDHLICLDCGHIVEFEDDEIERRQEALAHQQGFKIKRHKHELYVSCMSDPCEYRKN